MNLKFIFFCCFFINLSFSDELFLPIESLNVDMEKVKLGEKIYFDTNFNDKKISCNTCHNLYLNKSGTSVKTNPPTLLNVAFSTVFEYKNFDSNLFERTKKSIFMENELGSDEEKILAVIKKNTLYKKEFEKIYGDEITINRVVETLVEFEKSIITPDSKFDNFLQNKTKLSENELNGFFVFLNSGCAACHNGVNFGTNVFTFSLSRNAFVKVPTLRNITKTQPYFNGDSDLKRTISNISIQQGIELRDDEVFDLVEFLKTLEGKI